VIKGAAQNRDRSITALGPERLNSFARSVLSPAWIRAEGLDVTEHWTHAAQEVAVGFAHSEPGSLNADYPNYWLQRYKEAESWKPHEPFNRTLLTGPLALRVATAPEDLTMIAEWFKDGFDAFKNVPVNFCEGDTAKAFPKLDAHEAALAHVKDAIAKANPGVFAPNGSVIPKDWTRIVIPENTVDVFQLYTHLVLKMCRRQVSWADSWYYHLLDGGLHCGTNVLRR
jgi:hypothetical protein